MKAQYWLRLTAVLLCFYTPSLYGQLTGIKYIPGTYSTIAAAVTALNTSGPGSGGVTFYVAAGYAETISATLSITTTGTAANPIVFQKDPGTTGANPLITAYTGGVGTPATATQDGIWRLLGSDYITINGIDLQDNPSNTTNPSTMEYGYALYKASTSNGCQFVTIENCTITLNRINNATGTAPMVDGSSGIIVMNATASAATTALVPIAGGTNSNNKFYGNTIQNCNTGIAVIGYAAASPFTLADASNDIGGNSLSTGNTIINFGGATGATNAAAGIRTLAQHGLNVAYNTINNNNGGGINHPNVLRGIYINTSTSASETITNNIVTVKGGGTTQAVIGIENDAGATAASNSVTISNNTVTNCSYTTATTGPLYGIYNNAASPATLTIRSNTISNDSNSAGTTGFLYAIYNSGIATSVTISSNTISGNATALLTTGLFCGIYNAAAVPSLTIDSNTFFNNYTTSASGLHIPIYNSAAVTTTLNINYNNIGTNTANAITFNAANSGAQIFIDNAGGGAACALSISNNIFQGINYATAGTGGNTYIANSAATLSQAINNNTFTNLNVNTAGSITFISNSVAVSASGTQNVNSNAISGTFTKAAGGTITLFTSAATSISGAVINNNSNNFSNITISGATIIAGWANTDAGAGTKTIQNNTFSNWTGATGAITAMSVNLTSANNATTGNTINNISCACTIVGIATAVGNDNINLNTIDTLTTTGALAVTGISVTSGTNKKINKNKIYHLVANNAGGTVNGISVSGTSVVTANIYNNLISDLSTPISSAAADPVRGIAITSTSSPANVNVYYNTIYLNASSSGAIFGSTGVYHTANATATKATLDLRNNIIINTSTPNGTGLTVAYRRSSNATANFATTSNNNLFFAGSPATNHLIYYDGTNSEQTLINYQTLITPIDSASVTDDITTKFLSTNGSSSSFLHLNTTVATQAESGGAPITGYTSDYDGDIRQGNTGYTGSGIAPDIGADEFDGIIATGLSGTYTVGSGGNFTSLTETGGLFASINNFGLSGNVVVNIISDLTEDGTNNLYQWLESGAGNYTLTIQTNSATLRTISGNVAGALITMNGVDRVTIDGSYSGVGNYLTFTNTNTLGTVGTAFTFIGGATNNTIRYCNINAYANATNGVILFSTSTVAGGNSNNTISYCSINATVSGNSGNVCIYSAGTAANANSTNTISNNNIYNFHDRALDITATGSSGWTISGNSIYNGTVSGNINYAAASTLQGIRVLGGSGYSILNNYIGGSAASAGGGTALDTSSTGLLTYTGILLTTSSASPASNIKGNTIAGIYVSCVPSAANSLVFEGIETNGSGVNIGGTLTGDGNTIGSNSSNGSISVTTSTATNKTSLIRGIYCNSSNGLIDGNQVGGIDIKNIGATPGASTIYGIYVNSATAPSQVNNNIIGSTGAGAASNSIRVLPASTAVGTTLTGIAVGATVTSTIQVNNNIVRNISHQSSSTTAGTLTGISNAATTPAVVTISGDSVLNNTLTATTGAFYGIYNIAVNPTSLTISNNMVSGNSTVSTTTGTLYGIYTSGAPTTITITNNTVASNITPSTQTGVFAGIYNSATPTTLNINSNTLYGDTVKSTTGVHYHIYNTGAVTTTLNINTNNIGTNTANAITFFNVANSGAQIFINNTAGAATAALSISNNNIQGVNYATAGTGSNTYISNTAATLSQAINSNTFTNLSVSTTGSITFIANSVIVPATGTQNVNNNSISGTFTKSAGGTVTLFSSAAASATGAVINNNSNNFSNITVSGATTIAGWVNTDVGTSTKTIQNNIFSSWTGGTSAITALTTGIAGTNNAITGNAINNISCACAITGIVSGAGNDNIYLNTLNTFSSTGAFAVTVISITGGTTKNIYQNKIYDIQGSSASSTVNGILVSGTTIATINIYNNLIGDLRAIAANVSAGDPIRGISITATAANSTINVSFNTLYLNATSSGTNFGTSVIFHTASATATTAKLNLRNNIIANTSTPNGNGITVAYRRSSTNLTNYGSTSNNNLYYAGTASTTRLLFYDGTNKDQVMSTFQTRVANRDSVSVTENVTTKFLSTTGSSSLFLHISSSIATLVESGAANVSGITTDYDGQIRAGNPGYPGISTSPDIGADEISGLDSLPPTITYTVLGNTTSTSNRSLTGVTITDNSGVNTTVGTKPRIYYKRLSDANTWLDNTASTSGWKYTEATNSSSPFSFTIDYTLLFKGTTVVAGPIQYFVVAQDVATIANVGINSGVFNSTPASVALTSAAFPVTGTIDNYNIPFSGTYNLGTTEVFSSFSKANGLFAAINSAGLMGNTTINVTSDVTEDGTTTFNQWTESGVGNYTLTIQPDDASLRTISGNVTGAMISFNGADRVSINGSNGGAGNYLTFRNTNTAGATGTAFTFANGSANDSLNYCNIEAYANATNGVILFSTSSVSGGNSNDVIINCNVNATVSSNTGNVCIYSSGTVGNENSNNTISNNSIYNYRDRALDITSTGSSGWTISGNSLYNGTVSGSVNYAAGSGLHGIRILGGAGYSILSNYIGGNAALASGSNAVYSSGFGNVSYQGILLTTNSSSPVSNIKSNTIAGISVSSLPGSSSSLAFEGIETNGSGINVGGTSTGDGNTIGSATGNGSIVITTTTTSTANTSVVRGINCSSTGGIISRNQAAGIDINNTGSSPASSTFNGIYINSASPPAKVDSNTIGSTTTSNSIRILSASTATTNVIYGILAGSSITSAAEIDTNTIENISNLSTTSSGAFIGINNTSTSSAFITINNNTIKNIGTAANSNSSSTVYSGITSTSSSKINNNTINNISLLATGSAAQVFGINVSGAFLDTISGNVISNLSTASTKTADIETGAPSGYDVCGILNSASVSGQLISGNIISACSSTTTSATNTAITAIAVAGTSSSGNINNNKVYTFTNTATGTSTFPGISGIMATNGQFNVYNNSIRVSNSTNTNGVKIYGINHAAGNNWNYYFNSIRISGSSTGTARTAAFIRPVSGTLLLKNNVFVNTRTGSGSNYAISNIVSPPTSNWTSSTADYNDLYSATAATTAEWGAGTNSTFSQWQTSSSGGSHSVNSSVSFVTSTTDLTPNSLSDCFINNAGTPITSPVNINIDINNVTRSSTNPDLGAYEFTYTAFTTTANNSSPVCNGSTVALSSDPGNALNPTYSWTDPTSTVISTAQNPTVTALSGLYMVTITDVNGCSASSNTTVSLNARPTAVLTGATSICQGSSTNLNFAATGIGTISGTLNSGDVFSGIAPTFTLSVSPVDTIAYSIINMSDSNCNSIVPTDVPDTVTVIVTHPGNWLGTSSANWNDASNWCGGIPDSTFDILIPSGVPNYPTISSGTGATGDLTIKSGASLTINGATVQIGGTIYNSGSINAGSGSIEMNGSSAQVIPTGLFSSNTVNNLKINNSAGVSLSGALNISGVLYPANGNFTTNSYLTLLSTATQTALIDGSGSGQVLGNVTMQCYLPKGFGYKYFSSPFQSATVSSFSNSVNLAATFPTFYSYNENVVSSGWVNDTAAAGSLTPFQGYAANFGTSTSPETVSFSGVVNNNTINSGTLYNHNQPYTLGFNLVGNPYPSPIDWNASSGWTKTNIDNAVYYFNASDTNQYTGTYSSYINGVSSDGIANNIIPAMQGFFIHVSNGTYPVSGSITLTNAARIDNLSPVFHKSTSSVPFSLLRIGASFADSGPASDLAVIYFSDSASVSYNKTTDALKLMNTDLSLPGLYALAPDATKLSIRAIHNPADTEIVVPLGIQTARKDWVLFNACDIEKVPFDMHIYFTDMKTGKKQDLQTDPQYQVYLDAGKFENRFYIVFSKSDTIHIPLPLDELDAYTTGKKLFVYMEADNGELLIINMLGQTILKQKIYGKGYHETDLDVNNGNYVITLYSAAGRLSKKIFIVNN